jgi:hypothetical protein
MYTDPKFIKTVPANVEGRDFVVGDLHGCFDELTKLMKYVRFDPKRDRLFSTGDLIDRGPNSEECLSLLDKSWFYPVLGNHEDLLLTKIKLMEKGQNPELTQEEIIIIKQSESYLPKIFSMPLVYEIEHLLYDKIYILHAEILPEHLTGINQENDSKEYDRYFNSMKRFDFSESILDFFNSNRFSNIDYNLKQKLIWSRKFASSFYKDHKTNIDNSDFSFLIHEEFSQKVKIFSGHNVVPFPMKIGQQYYIDTGSALGYSSKDINSYLFTQFGHEFFALSMVDLTTGICYGCISSSNNNNYKRGEVLKLEQPIYEYNQL